MTSTPRRCRAMITSLPSSPEPSSMTLVAEGESGVPRRTGVFMEVNADRKVEESRDDTKSCGFWTAKNGGAGRDFDWSEALYVSDLSTFYVGAWMRLRQKKSEK